VAKDQQSSKEIVCYNCQKKGHIARFCPQSSDARQNSQTTSTSPDKVRRCFRCQSTQHLARFCPKINNSGDRYGQTAQVTVSACFGDTCMSPAACAFSRDVVTGARTDGPTDVCAFSRSEPADSQVCVDNGMPVDDESSEWAFCEFPKIDTAIIIIIIIIINRFVQRHKVETYWITGS